MVLHRPLPAVRDLVSLVIVLARDLTGKPALVVVGELVRRVVAAAFVVVISFHLGIFFKN